MNNINEVWLERRKHMEQYFVPENMGEVKETYWKEYKLVIEYYSTKKGSWNYTRGKVFKRNISKVFKEDTLLFDLKRSYSSFPYIFVEHNNGNIYFICGEDYQGYTVCNLTTGEKHTILDNGWEKGNGFCITEFMEYYDDKDILVVEGCYWGGGYNIVDLDFSNPDSPPYEELDSRPADVYDDWEDGEADY